MQWAGVTASWPRLSWDSCLPGHHRGPRPGVATSKGSRFCSGHGLIRTCEAGGRSSPRPRRPCTAPPAPRATAPAPWDHVPLVPTLHRQAPPRGPAGTLLPPRAWRALRLPAGQPRPAPPAAGLLGHPSRAHCVFCAGGRTCSGPHTTHQEEVAGSGPASWGGGDRATLAGPESGAKPNPRAASGLSLGTLPQAPVPWPFPPPGGPSLASFAVTAALTL